MKKSAIWRTLAMIPLGVMPTQVLADWEFVAPGQPVDLSIAVQMPEKEFMKLQNMAGDAKSASAVLPFYAPSSSLEKKAFQPPLVGKDDEVTIWRSSSDLVSTTKSLESPSLSDIEHYCAPKTQPSRSQAWEGAYRCMKEMDRKQKTLALKPEKLITLLVVEPRLNMMETGYAKRAEKYRLRAEKAKANAAEKNALSKTAARVPASLVWPIGEAGWHLGDDFSQLTAMRKDVGALSDITAAHLDTGYLPSTVNEINEPAQFDRPRSATCSKSKCTPGKGVDNYNDGFLKSPGHGPATLSTLAGSAYTLDGEPVPLGAAPDLKVFSVDIGDSVVHLDSRKMAEGINYATQNGADVITISHGGLPSARLASAVNLAYENGTAVFAASGDYFDFVFGHTFREVVYPARYPRVMGVAGATYAKAGDIYQGESYGDDPSWYWLFRPGKGYFSRLGSWMLRGNYGPAAVMSDGVITAFAPNVTRALHRKNAPRLIGDNGAGTSHATPQAAAAAAYWLQANSSNFDKLTWRSWKKSEAVYSALSQSADTCFTDFNSEHYGVGLLKGKAALSFHYADESLLGPKGETVRLERRKEADLNTTQFIKLARSTNVLNSFSANFRQAVLQALHTELLQLALTSERVQKLLIGNQLCELVDGCHVCRREDLPTDFTKLANRVGKLKEASPTLKEVLVEVAKRPNKQAEITIP
jgi:hypothetical protein